MGVLQETIQKNLPEGLRSAIVPLSGWGRHAYVDCVAAYPRDLAELQQLLTTCRTHGYSVTPKGSGCSFGDIVTNRQGIVVDLAGWNDITHFDPVTGILTAQCGTSAGRILHRTLPQHWIPRGLPGTSFGTVAGLIANNVHGKDSFKYGNFGAGVVAMKVLLPNGDVVEASRDDNAAVFHAVVGGMGLVGIILEATLQLVRIPGSMVEVERQYFRTIPQMFQRFSEITDSIDMDTAWFDGFDPHGRGIFQTARWLDRDPDVPPRSMEYIEKKFMGKVPIDLVYPLVKPFACRATMRALNTLAFWGSKIGPDKKTLHVYDYYYPHMISIPDSPKALKGGLVGFQIVAPTAAACEFISRLLALCRQYKLESWFGGVKRLRADPDPFLMSFAEDGYAITIEIPGRFTKRKTFPVFLDRMVALTVEHKGKIFLGKDAFLKPSHIHAMYPQLPQFLAMRKQCDPHALLASDLSRRLSL